MLDSLTQAVHDAAEADLDITQLMKPKKAKPVLEFFREGDGRYEVIHGGLRLGLVLGGAGHWVAETPDKRHISCKTRKEASEVLLSCYETRKAQAGW